MIDNVFSQLNIPAVIIVLIEAVTVPAVMGMVFAVVHAFYLRLGDCKGLDLVICMLVNIMAQWKF